MAQFPSNEPELRQPEFHSSHSVEEDTIDLSQIIAFIGRNWVRFGISVVLALICGAALFVYLPSRWTAAATVEVGQMPVGATVAGLTVGLIEPPPQAAARLQQRELINTALTSLHVPTDQIDNSRAKLIRHTLKPSVVKNTNFIQIGVEGYSPQNAHDNLVAAVNSLIDAHNKLMSPIVDRMKLRLEDNTRQLADEHAELLNLKATVQEARKPTAKTEFAPHVIAVAELADREIQISKIKAERVVMEDVLTSSRTYPTRVINAVYVEPNPSFPKLPLFLAVAAILGLAFGFGWALCREWRTRTSA